MTRDSNPAVLVGVGSAGIEILSRFADSEEIGWGTDDRDTFEFVAVDTDRATLERAPSVADTLCLDLPSEVSGQSTQTCPYLTNLHHEPSEGSDRQRGLGRHALERTDGDAWTALVNTLFNAFERVLDARSGGYSQQLTVVHLHALGGGTGSGTMPLVAHALAEATRALRYRSGLSTYTAGIGIVPEPSHNTDSDADTITSHGDARHYTNAYATLRDLETLLTAESEPVPLYRYPEYEATERSPVAISDFEPIAELDTSPYNHYFLVGIDEHRIANSVDEYVTESYRVAVNNIVVAAIYGLITFQNDLTDWFPPPTDTAHFGIFDQTQLSLPIKTIERYCDLCERILSLREQVRQQDGHAGSLRISLQEMKEQRETLQRFLTEETLDNRDKMPNPVGSIVDTEADGQRTNNAEDTGQTHSDRAREGSDIEKSLTDDLTRLETRIASLREELTRKERELRDAIAKRERIIEELTTGAYGSRLGVLALDEKMVREELDRQTFETELDSLAAFDEQGFLSCSLVDVMQERVQLAYAWDQPLLMWSDTMTIGNYLRRTLQKREIWMLHSEENDTLSGVEFIGAGQHVFRRSGTGRGIQSLDDPYTVQFLSYAVDAPLNELRIYADLDTAARHGRIDAVLERWTDYRLAFAYPEWYGRNIRQFFNMLTTVELSWLPELDIDNVEINRDGSELLTWLSSHGLASYLWLGDEWSRYDGFFPNASVDPPGWKTKLTKIDFEYHDMRRIVPSGDPVRKWFHGLQTWEWLLGEVERNLREQEGIEIEWQ